MQKAMYKVKMTFLAEKDDYNEGLTGELGSYWEQVAEFDSLVKAKEFVKDNTWSGYDYIEYDDYSKHYRTGYTTDKDNNGEISDHERKLWKQGKLECWYVDITIQVKKFTPKIIGNIKFN